MPITFKNSRTNERIGLFNHPVVPRKGETVILEDGTEAEVADVDHVLGVSGIIVWLTLETGTGRAIMRELGI